MVWDEEVELSGEDLIEMANGNKPNQIPLASPTASINTVPLPATEPRRHRSQSASDFPPPMRRVSTEYSGVSRPVSFSAKFSRVHPATTGVTVLEHMERLDAVEAGLKRLGVEESVIEEEEEMDVGDLRPKPRAQPPRDQSPEASTSGNLLSPPHPIERLPSVPEDEHVDHLAASVTEEDLVMMSKSMSHIDSRPSLHTRWSSHGGRGEERANPNLDWMHIDPTESPKKRTVIVEVSVLAFSFPYLLGSQHVPSAFGNGEYETDFLMLVMRKTKRWDNLLPVVVDFALLAVEYTYLWFVIECQIGAPSRRCHDPVLIMAPPVLFNLVTRMGVSLEKLRGCLIPRLAGSRFRNPPSQKQYKRQF